MKKTLALLLVYLMLLASCASSPEVKGEEGRDAPDLTPAAETAPETEPARFVPDVPAKDFGGATFRVGGVDPSFVPTILVDFDFEEDSGEVVQSALFSRNRRIEADYGILFDCVYLNDYNATRETLNQCVKAGDGSYQLMMLICREAFPASVNGNTLPYSEIPYLDFSQPWYLHRINDMMTVGGVTVLAYSDMCMNAYLQTVCVLFNKELLDANQLEDPYTAVREGRWTTELFYSMSESAVRDADGDGKYGKNDVFGIVSETDMFFPSMWVGADSRTVTKDVDDVPVFTAPTDEKFLGILSRLSDKLVTDGLFCDDFKIFEHSENGRNIGTSFFAQNGGLFRVGCVGFVSLLREMETDFGILPLPKYDEAQTEYYGRMIDGWLHIVPNTPQDAEMQGIIMEALGAESRNYVIPAYFDIALTYKYTRDKDSEEMLSMIFDNAMVDLGDTIWYDTVRSPLTGEIASGRSDFVSYFKTREKVVNKTIEKQLKTLTGGN